MNLRIELCLRFHCAWCLRVPEIALWLRIAVRLILHVPRFHFVRELHCAREFHVPEIALFMKFHCFRDCIVPGIFFPEIELFQRIVCARDCTVPGIAFAWDYIIPSIPLGLRIIVSSKHLGNTWCSKKYILTKFNSIQIHHNPRRHLHGLKSTTMINTINCIMLIFRCLYDIYLLSSHYFVILQTTDLQRMIL